MKFQIKNCPVGEEKVGDEMRRKSTSSLRVTGQTILKHTATCIGYIIKDVFQFVWITSNIT